MMIRLTILLLLTAAFLGCTQSSSADPSWDYLAKAVDLNNQATMISNSGPSPAVIPEGDMKRIKELWSRALDAARKVDESVLNDDEPGFGDRFRDEFREGLELCVGATDNADLVRGQLLLERFGTELNRVLKKKRSR